MNVATFALRYNLKYIITHDKVEVLVLPSVDHTFTEKGVEMVRGVSPVLLTADEGKTWTPNVLLHGHPMWEKKYQLKKDDLASYCVLMYNTLQLEGITAMLIVLANLQRENVGE